MLDAGVVYQNPNRSEGCSRIIHHLPNGIAISQVGIKESNPVLVSKAHEKIVRIVATKQSVDTHSIAELDQPTRHTITDSRSGPSNQGVIRFHHNRLFTTGSIVTAGQRKLDQSGKAVDSNYNEDRRSFDTSDGEDVTVGLFVGHSGDHQESDDGAVMR